MDPPGSVGFPGVLPHSVVEGPGLLFWFPLVLLLLMTRRSPIERRRRLLPCPEVSRKICRGGAPLFHYPRVFRHPTVFR